MTHSSHAPHTFRKENLKLHLLPLLNLFLHPILKGIVFWRFLSYNHDDY